MTDVEDWKRNHFLNDISTVTLLGTKQRQDQLQTGRYWTIGVFICQLYNYSQYTNVPQRHCMKSLLEFLFLVRIAITCISLKENILQSLYLARLYAWKSLVLHRMAAPSCKLTRNVIRHFLRACGPVDPNITTRWHI